MHIELRDKQALVLGALIFSALFLAFYPKFWDVDYLATMRTANWIWEGKFVEHDPQYAFNMFPSGKGFFVYPFEIGRTLVSAPLALVSWNAPFILGLLFHLAGFFYFYKILRHLSLSPYYSLLYLFFPSIAVSANAFLLGEIASVSLITIAAYFYMKGEKNDLLVSGLIFGLSVWFRATNLAFLLAFALAMLWKRREGLLRLLAGMGLSAAPFFALTYSILGVPVGYFYAVSPIAAKEAMGPAQLAASFFQYIVFLMLGAHPFLSRGFMFVLPLSLATAFISRHLRLETLLSILFGVIVFSTNGLAPAGRYFVPIIPLLLLGSISWADGTLGALEKKIRPVKKRLVIGIVAVFFMAITAMALYIESGRGQVKFTTSMEIYSSTKEGALIVDIEGGHMSNFLLEKFGNRRLEAMDENALLSKLGDGCWLERNGGTGNIYVGGITLHPRQEFSIRGFMDTNILTLNIGPLQEYAARKGVQIAQACS